MRMNRNGRSHIDPTFDWIKFLDLDRGRSIATRLLQHHPSDWHVKHGTFQADEEDTVSLAPSPKFAAVLEGILALEFRFFGASDYVTLGVWR